MDKILIFISESVTAFFILQLLNVILSTLKTVTTVKSPFWLAAVVNAVYYGFYTFIIKAIGDADFKKFCGFDVTIPSVVIIAIITILTNLIGVYISLKMMDKMKKDDIWLLKITVKNIDFDEFIEEVRTNKLRHLIIKTGWSDEQLVEIYSNSKDESRLARKIIERYKDAKCSCIVTKRV